MKELYDNALRVGGLVSIVVAVLGMGNLLALGINGYIALTTLMAVLIVGGTQVQLLRSIQREVADGRH